MDTTPHTLTTLFEQLGLPSDRTSIDNFIASYRLEPGVRLPDAPFWTESQASFLRNSLRDDADWAVEVDELAVRLSPQGA
ncbi:DUF2789 domain-containing protein [Pseudomonas sp. LS44]|uniref:DUF2789 domain-containing protein n=1 Tax=Pseudomonas sp. LS44 TaxID=1357074 RepID=UPI00215ABC4F|nr:DUF2789 domain-containing protein [Pseudomonas sp. LS44]UVE18673.1 DUF2789 domain-containing protein [Pseudomonas sp. LS44]